MIRVTISDVARAAGVSMKSVSRVINNEPNVSEKLRAKVQAAVDSLGYVPDLAARSLAGGRSFALGILLDNPSPNYTMKLLTGAYRACRRHGYHLLIGNLDMSQMNVEEQVEEALLNIRVDGMILTPPISSCAITMAALDRRGIAYVCLAPDGVSERAPAITIDDEGAGYLVGEHFIALGHKRFGIALGPASHSVGAARRNGFIRALVAHGLPSPKEAFAGFTFEGGIVAGHALMEGPDRPTAIFATNDDSAAGVMAALSELHIRVPHDVSIVGFDDSWIARSVWPNLTTIYQPIAEMAEAAADLLLQRGRQTIGNRDIQLGYHLVQRQSTGPILAEAGTASA